MYRNSNLEVGKWFRIQLTALLPENVEVINFIPCVHKLQSIEEKLW
jgi:hypothetical protein